ncbi:hypothetical protein IE4771_PB00288 (plasmid) [Rhizobium etli bv. mimosae str. IE4771]|uniref:Uncharacterized protein n=1 Tax=Rhizobium etli bv. mimosae str. IE4771 TaxID=1432050 RepID=A0A060IEA4_RHIET|nr:hypothetical protein IE4771_PB00288 [Rhizobium sp. IE4771]
MWFLWCPVDKLDPDGYVAASREFKHSSLIEKPTLIVHLRHISKYDIEREETQVVPMKGDAQVEVPDLGRQTVRLSEIRHASARFNP